MFSNASSSIPDWSTPLEEGQLSVDVFRKGKELIIRSTVAGAKPEDIDISVHGDLLTLRGKRESEQEVSEEDWYYRECYWGTFSRSIVLPYEVNAEKAEASMKNGVLEVKIPIRESGDKSIKVKIQE